MAALLVLGVEVVSAQSDVVPGTPTSVATTSSNAEATVTWLAPIANGGTAVIGYSVAWASNAVQGMTSGSAVVATATTTTSPPATAVAPSTATTVAPPPTTTRSLARGMVPPRPVYIG